MTVQGTVVSSKLDRKCQYDGPCHWYVFVDYAYEIDGSQFAGKQRWGVGHTGKVVQTVKLDDVTKGERRTIMARYAPGAAVPVHYYPLDANGAWLLPRPFDPQDPPFLQNGIFFAFVGLMILVWGVVVVVVWFRVETPGFEPAKEH